MQPVHKGICVFLLLMVALVGFTVVVSANDWDAIEEAARAEGKVVVYSFSSRIMDVKQTFEEAYPGITVEASNLKSYDLVEKVDREHAAGIRNADVIFISDGEGSVIGDLLQRGVIKNFVPDDLVDLLPEDRREPLLTVFTQANVPYYNTSLFEESPVDSWWDLTRPEWKGRILMSDPLSSAETLGMFIAMVQHADEMAAAYKAEFGEEIVTRKGENAGHEFMRRLIDNDPVFVKSGSNAVDGVGKGDIPMIGLASSPKLREVNQKGLSITVAWDIAPALGVTTKAYVAMMADTPNPNAAALLVRWMMGDSEGGQGYAPFHVPGSWSSRSDVGAPPDSPAFEDVVIWSEDPAYVWVNGMQVRDFWMSAFK